ncbi:hypothetical protein Tco_1556054, partial [Tanacetum coccineum]
MVAKESPVALISQSFTDADVRGSPNTNKKHNVSVAVTKPSPRVRSSATPNSVPQDGILDDAVNENRQWHGSSCHGSGQRINLAAEGADTAQRNSSIHGIHLPHLPPSSNLIPKNLQCPEGKVDANGGLVSELDIFLKLLMD